LLVKANPPNPIEIISSHVIRDAIGELNVVNLIGVADGWATRMRQSVEMASRVKMEEAPERM
jgi:hypothetical protein